MDCGSARSVSCGYVVHKLTTMIPKLTTMISIDIGTVGLEEVRAQKPPHPFLYVADIVSVFFKH